jgi:hypothetical protein
LEDHIVEAGAKTTLIPMFDDGKKPSSLARPEPLAAGSPETGDTSIYMAKRLHGNVL